jgi:hypothetical protein
LFVELDQVAGEMAAYRSSREQSRKFGVSEKPVGVKACPVVVVAARVREDGVMDFTDLV